MIADDAETDVLATDELYEVLLCEGQVVSLDADLFAVREVGLCATSEVTDNSPSGAGGQSSGAGCVREKAGVEVYFETLERIHVELSGILGSLELRPCSLVHNDNRIDCLVGKGAERYLIDKDGYRDFDERSIVRDALGARKK